MFGYVVAFAALAAVPMTEVPDAWALPRVMGRDFWTLQCMCDCVAQKTPGVYELSGIKEAAVRFHCTKPIVLKEWKRSAEYPKKYVEPIPDAERHTKPYKLTDLTHGAKALRGEILPDRPFMLSSYVQRPAFFVQRDGYPLADRGDYAKWRAAHPNFVGIEALDEFDSDANYFRRFYGTLTDEGLKAAYPYEVPNEGSPAVGWAKTAFDNASALFFGERALVPMCSNQPSFAHIFAAVGATMLSYEATTQSYPSWQVAASYTRGASRQFGLPTRWYTANYYGGYTRDGQERYGENRWANWKGGKCPPSTELRAYRPHRGASRSLLKRQAMHGWLIGSTFFETEHWGVLYGAETNRVPCASPEGLDYEAVYRLSKRVDRGVPITPLAVLTPVTDPMYTSGMFQNAKDRFTPAAIFHTLVPIGRIGEYTGGMLRKVGEQGCLFNTPFADMCDVVAPDAGQKTDALVKALSAYPYAILAGSGFHRDRLDVVALERYVRGGGTLVVSADQIGLGYVTAEMCGVEFSQETVAASGDFADMDGATHPLKGEYRVFRGTPRGAKTLLTAEGVPLAYENACGRGRVITLACKKGLPARYADSPRMSEDEYLQEFRAITATDRTFEVYRWLLDRIQSEKMPVLVKGSAQWGVNRTKKGYLVYVFNNKGVVKFCDEPEEFDMSKTSKVTIDARRLGAVRIYDPIADRPIADFAGKVSFEVAPGDVRLVEVVAAGR